LKKQNLRNTYKTLRNSLTSEQIEDYSLAIANRLLQLDIWNFEFYHLFLPIKEQHEINTEYILNILAGKDKNVVISKSNFEDRSMKHYLLTDNTTIKLNSYNIPEPIGGIEIATSQLEVVFIPLLVFDKAGNRIGYGKGFYDRFLAGCKPEALKIGLSFFDAETENFEVSDDDIGLDYCVTPEKIYRFN
jgi:5-formyltetrahydrofolate cyclo-ligase